MREILFRGKRTDNGEWIDGFYVRLFEKDNGFYKAKHYIFDGNIKLGEERYCGHGNYEQDVKICKFEVDPETVGQYTGLTDKNGTKIFEGDIVQSIELKLKGIIVFDEHCRFMIKDLTTGSTYLLSYNNDEIQVIGNITDNPELLGDK